MFCLKQVERAFSVCGTIEYMAPEIVEGGESGHDKVIFCRIILETCCVSFSLLMAASCVPGSGLVEPRCFDVWASDRRIALHRGRRQQLTHGHRQVRIPPDCQLCFVSSNDLWPYLSRTSQEDIKKRSSFPQRYGAAGQRHHPAAPHQRSKEKTGLRTEWSGECEETPILPGGSGCLLEAVLTV